MTHGTADFADSEDSKKSPLARRLFQIDGVTAVFLGGDFVAVTKTENLDWFTLKPAILAGIMEHYASGLPVVENDAEIADPHAEGSDSDTFSKSNSFWTHGCVLLLLWMAGTLYFKVLMTVL